MATIKSFTDLQQSKKLAEILPIESADMCYPKDAFEYHYAKEPVCHYSGIGLAHPCWSLSALISVIPQELFDGEYIINITEGLNHKWIISYEHYSEVSSYIDVSSDNLIDCCVEMIIKLKERKLL